jgi:hypothetical protein
LLRRFSDAIHPLEKADMEELLSTLGRLQRVDKGAKQADHTL